MKNKISKKIILELIELYEMKIKELGNERSYEGDE